VSACIFVFTVLQSATLTAQVKNIGLPKIVNYKKSDYHGGSQNWDIGQDKKGNLYFGNNMGLIQFNGTSWSRYTIPNATVRSLKISESGKVYVGGYNEFGYFDTDSKGKLVYHSLSKKVSANAKKFMDFVWKIHIIKDEVFFQTFNRTYIYKDNKITILEAPNRFQFSFLANGKLYFQDISSGLLEYNKGTLVPLRGTDILNNTEVWGVLPKVNDLLIITLDKGLFLYKNGTLTPWECEANTFVKTNNSLGGRVFNNKFIVLSSVRDGIIICDANGKIVQHINNRKGLENNTALSSFIDDTNNLWLGLDNGIAFINENSPFSYMGSSYGLNAVYASVIYQGNLYVATNQGVFRHDWNKTFKEESFKFLEGTTGQAWNIQEIDGELFCSHNRGAFIIRDGRAGQLLDDGKGYLGFKKLPGQPGYLIGSNYHGFAIFEKTSGGWKLKNQIEGFSNADDKFATDGKNIWQVREHYVYQLKLSSDFKRFSMVTTHNTLQKGLKGITSVQRLRGVIYFQTDNRFFTYSQSKDRFIEDKKISALFSDIPKIRYCFEDNRGNICYFYKESSMGMLMKQKDGSYKNVLSPFSSLTGDLIYYFESINTIDEKNIFIGLTEGLVHYNPQLQNASTSKPKAFIRSFSFPGDTLVTGNMDNIEDITLPYKSNNVKFTFSSPIYDNPEKIRFSYKLSGFDDKWSNWTAVPVKEYTNLHEGSYKMQVKVINSYGLESDPAVISFTLSPPFYRHFLAYILYVLLIAFTIFYIRRSVKLKIRKNKYYETLEQRRLYLEKETKIRQEQFELEKEIERLKNEQLKLKILTKDKELVSNSLQVVKKNKLLNGIIHRLKDIDSETMDETAKLRFNKLYKTILKELNTDKSWNNLEKHIRNVHFDFLKRLKEQYPAITPREMDLATYLLMNMSTKEIAEIMNISDGGVELARYRLRKKLDLSRKENLTGFLMSV
jgi:DNA-binding CsgD family transcriptional regulator